MTPERWKQIEALYHAARTRSSGEREAFLASECAGDEALRREVESLLNEPVSEEGFLDQSALARAAEMGTKAAPITLAGRAMGGYRLQSLLGSGGMGEVYRAHDDKLRRDVAIKILSRAFTSDRDRLTRFEREARMLAALNHPNICAIYGLDDAGGTRFLILELVEGETLAEKLATVPRTRTGVAGLPLASALSIAKQIAEALQVAHEKGIVHRDLKPANIKITPAGIVKVLDFGLAKTAFEEDHTVPGHAPTMSLHGTQDGVVVGTPAYMSPEQARAQPIDTRTDIWAFGCVLYEMLTGRVAFAGDTAVETIARILEREPDWSALPATVPDPIRKLLRGCLAKDPQVRLRDIGEVKRTIDDVLSEGSDRTRARARWLPWSLVGASLLGLAGLAVWNLRTPPAAPVFRGAVQLPAGQELDASGGAHTIALAPNGARMAFAARPNLLYIRVMDNPDSTPIPDMQQYVGMREPVFSPDGLSIAFYAFKDSTIKTMSITGGATAVTICPADTPLGMNWGPEGIVYGQGRKGIWLVSPGAGSEPHKIANVSDDERAHGPQILPDGRHLIFTVTTGDLRNRWDKASVVVQPFPLGDAERKTLINAGSDARYLPSKGLLFYAVSGQLYAVRIDPQRLEPTGAPVSIVPTGISRAAGAFTGAAQYSFSTTGAGLFVYVPGPVMDSESAPLDLAEIDLKAGSNPESLGFPPGAYTMPRLSPDGKRIAVTNEDDKVKAHEIWIRDLKSTLPPRALTNGGNNRFAAWTRDGKRIAFQSDRDGGGMFWQAADGTGTATRLGSVPAPGESYEPESWSPTSDTLLFSKTRGSDTSLWTYSVGDGKEAPFGNVHSSAPTCATFSHDGRWVAYTLKKGGITIEVQPFPATGAVFPFVAQGSDSPKHVRWSSRDDELIYDPRPGAFEAVRVATQPQFSFGASRLLPHRYQGAPPGARTPYDVTPDGKLVGMITWGQPDFARGPLDQIQVTTSWFDWLKGRLPSR